VFRCIFYFLFFSVGRRTAQNRPQLLRRPGSCAVGYLQRHSRPPQTYRAVPGPPATTKPEKTSIYSGRAKCSHFCWFRPPARHKSSRHSGGRGSAKFGSAGYRWPTVRRMSPADAMKGIGQGFPGVGQHLSNPIEYHRSDRPFASVATGC
jgi:hypothetical protein